MMQQGHPFHNHQLSKYSDLKMSPLALIYHSDAPLSVLLSLESERNNVYRIFFIVLTKLNSSQINCAKNLKDVKNSLTER